MFAASFTECYLFCTAVREEKSTFQGLQANNFLVELLVYHVELLLKVLFRLLP